MSAISVKVLVLGSGTSTGVPIIGCRCPVCQSTDPHDNRLRSGVYLTCDGFALQIDLPPDFRQQVLRFEIARIDAVLLSHPHADHILGLDEIRQFNTVQKSRIPAYGRAFTLAGVGSMFSYICIPPPEQKALYRPQIDFLELGDEPIQLGPFCVTSSVIPHGPESSTAFKIQYEGRSFVYAPDCSMVSDDLALLMKGADVVMLDGLRDRPHPSHLTFETSVRAIESSGAGRGYLTHIGHDVLHTELTSRLPAHIRPAYDGLEFEW